MKKNENIFTKLGKLFSSDVIIKNVNGKIKVADINQIQGNYDLATNYLKHGFMGIHSSIDRFGYDETAMMSVQRTMLFRDYELMDNESLISSALDCVAEECSVKDEFGEVLTVKCNNQEVKSVLHNLFYDILNIEFNLYPWVRNLIKYGDFFLKLELVEKIGVVNVIPISAYEMRRLEKMDPINPGEVTFCLESPNLPKQEFKNYEIGHFRLLSDTNYLPYGKSFIEPCRRTWKQLQLMEDAMLIHRIMRAPEKRIFKIDVGNINPKDVPAYMEKVVSKIKKVPFIDQQTGDYNLQYNMMNITEDFYLPVRGGDSGTAIDTLGGLEYNAIEDIEYLRDKLLAALRVPKPFLGYGEMLNGKSTLAALDVRFSRSIERIQRIFVSELNKIAIVHLYMQGYRDDDLLDFELNLTSPSTIYEQEKISLWQEKTNLARDMKETKMFDTTWIYKNIFNFSDDQIRESRENQLEDQKRAFRYAQIESEGNDPVVSRQSFGTPHDLAVLQKGLNPEEEKGAIDPSLRNNNVLNYNEKPVETGGFEDPDRSKFKRIAGGDEFKIQAPQTRSHYGQDSHIRGRDPIGAKGYHTANRMSDGIIKYKDLINSLKNAKTSTVISESITEIKLNDDNNDENTFLNEKNIMDD